ncbi:MAG TPA: 50S ribosomal protein L23 [archaeon]|nr:50S ribosomal protein L23 [archaeon]
MAAKKTIGKKPVKKSAGKARPEKGQPGKSTHGAGHKAPHTHVRAEGHTHGHGAGHGHAHPHAHEGHTHAAEKPVQEKIPAKKGKPGIEELEQEIEGLNIIKYPLVTEKAVNMIEAENKLVFIVDGKASKPSVRKAIETLYKVKVNSVNMFRDMKSRKRAIVTIDKKFKANDIATKLGVI